MTGAVPADRAGGSQLPATGAPAALALVALGLPGLAGLGSRRGKDPVGGS